MTERNGNREIEQKLDRYIEDAGKRAGAEPQTIGDVKKIAHAMLADGYPPQVLAATADRPFKMPPDLTHAAADAAEVVHPEIGDVGGGNTRQEQWKDTCDNYEGDTPAEFQ